MVDGLRLRVVVWVTVALGVPILGSSSLTGIDDQVFRSSEVVEYEEFGSRFAVGDFDGDGYDDLAVGVPEYDFLTTDEVGLVWVFYGSPAGLMDTGYQVFLQTILGIDQQSEEDDHFGDGIAAGDFDDDGYDDLAIGVPGEDIGSLEGTGLVHVLYGSASGVTTDGQQVYSQTQSTILDTAEGGEGFGRTLATGNLNGDAYMDLVIGVPYEDIDLEIAAGAFHVLFGSASGLTTVTQQFWHQNISGTAGAAESGDRFAEILVTGDFNDDTFDDVAVGIWAEDVSAVPEAGAVHVFYGSSIGLTAVDDVEFAQGVAGVEDGPEDDDEFGLGLASGDFDGDGADDLAVGVPFEDFDGESGGGFVHVFMGGPGGLSGTDEEIWHQGSPGILDEVFAGDNCGYPLHTGDFDGDGRDDLVIGCRGDDFVFGMHEGAANVIYGGAGGLSPRGNQFVHQGWEDLFESPEGGDTLPGALASGDFNGGGTDDLIVGVPLEDLGAVIDAGVFQVIYGELGVFDGGFEGGDLLRWSSAVSAP
jgi:hypothetical protein